MATSGKEWRKPREEGIEIAFPSGNVARLRPISVTFLLRLNTIPQFATSMVMDMLANKGVPITTAEDVQKFYAVAESAARAMFISPRIVDEPSDDDEIAPRDLTEEDLEFLWQFLVGRPLAEMRSFPDKPESAVGLVDAAAGDAQDAK